MLRIAGGLNLWSNAKRAAQAQIQCNRGWAVTETHTDGCVIVHRRCIKTAELCGCVACGLAGAEGAVHSRWPIIEEVVAGEIIRRHDVVRFAGLCNEKWIEANRPWPGVVGHHEYHVGGCESRAPVVLADVV